MNDDVDVALGEARLLERALVRRLDAEGQPLDVGAVLRAPRRGDVAAGAGRRRGLCTAWPMSVEAVGRDARRCRTDQRPRRPRAASALQTISRVQHLLLAGRSARRPRSGVRTGLDGARSRVRARAGSAPRAPGARARSRARRRCGASISCTACSGSRRRIASKIATCSSWMRRARSGRSLSPNVAMSRRSAPMKFGIISTVFR